jgi:hypothetical protein
MRWSPRELEKVFGRNLTSVGIGPPSLQPHRPHGGPRDPIDLGGPMCAMGPEGLR